MPVSRPEEPIEVLSSDERMDEERSESDSQPVAKVSKQTTVAKNSNKDFKKPENQQFVAKYYHDYEENRQYSEEYPSLQFRSDSRSERQQRQSSSLHAQPNAGSSPDSPSQPPEYRYDYEMVEPRRLPRRRRGMQPPPLP